MDYRTEGVKLAADTATGVTIAEVNDSSSLIITLVTILSRLAIELIINRRLKRKIERESM
jgi:hypothetical protein